MSLINQTLLTEIMNSFEVLTDNDGFEHILDIEGDDEYEQAVMNWVSNHIQTQIDDEFKAAYNEASRLLCLHLRTSLPASLL